MERAPNGTYVNGVRVDDLRATLCLEPVVTNLRKPLRMTLSYAQISAIRFELEAMQRDMARPA